MVQSAMVQRQINVGLGLKQGLSAALYTLSLMFLVVAQAQLCAQTKVREWAWMGGSSTGYGPPGVYGTLGQFDPGNYPGGRDLATTWTDRQGHLWLFGGYGVDSDNNEAYLNDLWEFDPSRGADGEWAWMSGSKLSPFGASIGLAGVYGAFGQFGAANTPGARISAVASVDRKGRFWLFAGSGFDSSGTAFGTIMGDLNDVWEFDPSLGTNGEWAWMGGDSTIRANPVQTYVFGRPPIYGAIGQFAPGNTPGGRSAPAAWTDDHDNLWILGGECHLPQLGIMNDLWEFSTSKREWARMQAPGTLESGQYPGAYGDLGTFAAENIPEGRWEAIAWTGRDGKFWLFGGRSKYLADLNDLWEFDPSRGANGEWAWMGGSNSTPNNSGHPGVYGTLGNYAPGNMPGGRFNAVGWTQENGHFWLFGGQGFDSGTDFRTEGILGDLWEFDPRRGSTGEWAWKGGSSTFDGSLYATGPGEEYGIYGSMHQFADGNFPGGRTDAAGWTDKDGNFWLFGGWGLDADTFIFDLDDFWEYKRFMTQTIVFETPRHRVFCEDRSVKLRARGGGSHNPVVFSVVSGPAKVSGLNGSTLTVTGAGKVVVAANQAGNDEYAAAPEVTKTFEVYKSH
jgi:hypothetical protein